MKMANAGSAARPNQDVAKPKVDVSIVTVSLKNADRDSFAEHCEVIVCLDFDDLTSATRGVKQIRERFKNNAYEHSPLIVVAIPAILPTLQKGRISEALERAGAIALDITGPVDSSYRGEILKQVETRFEVLKDWAPPKHIVAQP